MKKIMFSDKCDLTTAVLLRIKTMTRRLLPKYMRYDSEHCNKVFIRNNELVIDFGNMIEHVCDLPYKVGEIVAIAQAYKDIFLPGFTDKYPPAAVNNKMFVKAELMPHRIEFTDVKVERLLDISDDDCLKEGIWLDNSIICDFPQAEGIHPYVFKVNGYEWYQPTPHIAFENIVRHTMGKKVLDANPLWY